MSNHLYGHPADDGENKAPLVLRARRLQQYGVELDRSSGACGGCCQLGHRRRLEPAPLLGASARREVPACPVATKSFPSFINKYKLLCWISLKAQAQRQMEDVEQLKRENEELKRQLAEYQKSARVRALLLVIMCIKFKT